MVTKYQRNKVTKKPETEKQKAARLKCNEKARIKRAKERAEKAKITDKGAKVEKENNNEPKPVTNKMSVFDMEQAQKKARLDNKADDSKTTLPPPQVKQISQAENIPDYITNTPLQDYTDYHHKEEDEQDYDDIKKQCEINRQNEQPAPPTQDNPQKIEIKHEEDENGLIVGSEASEYAKNNNMTNSNKTLTQPDESKNLAVKIIPIIELKITPINWLIKGLISCNTMNAIFGDPATGKSLLALDMAFCVATGTSFGNHEVKQSPVIYVAGEGVSGLPVRYQSLVDKYNKDAQELFVVTVPLSLINKSSALDFNEAMSEICPSAGLIVIDTLHRNLGDGDENSSKDIGAFISNIDNHMITTGAAVLIVHHSGHKEKDRGRGSSSFRASLDTEYQVSISQKWVVFKNTKAKDFKPPKDLFFLREMVKLDSEDEDEGGIYLELDEEKTEKGETTKPKKTNINHNDELAISTLYNAIKEHGVDAPPAVRKEFGCMKGKKIVELRYWREVLYRKLDVDSDGDKNAEENAKKSKFTRSRDKLLKLGIIRNFDGYYWEVKKNQ
jgi:hypothetical protein